jgi:hypothetical protein
MIRAHVRSNRLRTAPAGLCEAFAIPKDINNNNNNIDIMAVKYIPDELISEMSKLNVDIQKFIKEAIEEKIEKQEVS